jgi:hypothetical protein
MTGSWLPSAINKDMLTTNTSLLKMYKKSEGMVMPKLHHTASDSAMTASQASNGSKAKSLMAGVVSAAFNAAGDRPSQVPGLSYTSGKPRKDNWFLKEGRCCKSHSLFFEFHFLSPITSGFRGLGWGLWWRLRSWPSRSSLQ